MCIPALAPEATDVPVSLCVYIIFWVPAAAATATATASAGSPAAGDLEMGNYQS